MNNEDKLVGVEIPFSHPDVGSFPDILLENTREVGDAVTNQIDADDLHDSALWVKLRVLFHFVDDLHHVGTQTLFLQHAH